eukprot:gnl/TRDRNA2_/TRDRNA2_174847_c0_seq10.p1 gnl/TRDRNA2_/TRDRNA2_174847_c0~~gnl/TRDRNA2_/TRDRNA2_174847_c0_seq10.p1  ORF type:complete len:494 (-),score=73.83 gnl/TRDRNA2_/TRDRNA2_174847_c0_seq10:132-1613(-)
MATFQRNSNILAAAANKASSSLKCFNTSNGCKTATRTTTTNWLMHSKRYKSFNASASDGAAVTQTRKLVTQQQTPSMRPGFDNFLKAGGAKPVPEIGFEPITGPSVWTGDDLNRCKWWNHHLSSEDIDDLHKATEAAKASGAVQWLHKGVPDKYPKEAFPLGLAMQQKLADISEEIENGTGVAMIRNMPVLDTRFTEDDLAVMYLGVSAQIGHVIMQSSSGLRSVSRGYGLPLGRVQAEMTGQTPKDGKQTNNAFRFHTDRCDVISLLGVREAPNGGASRVASAPAIYNKMLERCPELARVLAQPIDRIWEGQNGFFRLPVWGLTPSGKFTTQISPSYVETAQYMDYCQKATEEQIRALDAIEDIGLEVGAEYQTMPGMLVWMNNHQVYHGRGTWGVTQEEQEGAWGNSGRLLFRTWISPYNSRALPDTPEYRFVWGNVGAGQPRGGYDQAVATGEVPVPKSSKPPGFEYYSLFDAEVQKRSQCGHCHTVIRY